MFVARSSRRWPQMALTEDAPVTDFWADFSGERRRVGYDIAKKKSKNTFIWICKWAEWKMTNGESRTLRNVATSCFSGRNVPIFVQKFFTWFSFDWRNEWSRLLMPVTNADRHNKLLTSR